MEALAVFSIDGARVFIDVKKKHKKFIKTPKINEAYKTGGIFKDRDGIIHLCAAKETEDEQGNKVTMNFVFASDVVFEGKTYNITEKSMKELVAAIEERRVINERRNEKDH